MKHNEYRTDSGQHSARGWAINLALVAVSLLVAALLAEGVLRVADFLLPEFDIVPMGIALEGREEARLDFDTNGSPIYAAGFRVEVGRGFRPEPAQYDADGFRVPDRTAMSDAAKRIGMFGDSYTEALQVDPDQSIPRVLAEELEKRQPGAAWRGFNFGVSATGTVHQYLRYLTVREIADLDYVILAFLPQNDVLNNHPELGVGFTLPAASHPRLTDTGVEFDPVAAPPSARRTGPYAWLKRHSYLAALLWRVKSQYTAGILYRPDGPRGGWLDVYGPPETEEWREAWAITEGCILQTQAAAEEEGSHFLLLLLTDALQVDHPTALEEQFDFAYPNRRLAAFAQEHGIDCLDTYDAFMAKKESLEPPYFSWPSDGHYSPLGTHFVAELIAGHLLASSSDEDRVTTLSTTPERSDSVPLAGQHSPKQ